ncbi:LytR/AlgR family response regulator transcription factor [Sphingomonas bacterium]|uniref:LytR/AlgR family response regulator transcription factor n=1 Tax=Sphingomonas bacterium TaxID=1895847 RepID=UPI001575FA15|nr:LytTR family DNA-binding domain-containing protein [Sphingomonas bacterium]
MADRLRVLVVDDEPAAIRRLVRLCEALPDIQIAATASDGQEALAVLDRITVDLILLDIEMPGMTGLAFAEHLVGRRPALAIVFITAFERFAIQAFAVNAVGYLLKPVDPALLRATIDRVTLRTAAVPPPQGSDAVFWAPCRGTLVRLEASDIDRISGEDNYVRLHCGTMSYLVAERLHAIERRLGSSGFVRIHRSRLVNRDRIVALVPDSGSWAVRLSSGAQLAVGRSFLPALRQALKVT